MEKKNNEVDDAEEECETPLTTSQPVRAERYISVWYILPFNLGNSYWRRLRLGKRSILAAIHSTVESVKFELYQVSF